MTKIYYMSDLHFEINGDLPMMGMGAADPDGILLVAGDTYVARYLMPDDFLTSTENKVFIDFLRWCTGFKKTYFVLGNHEHYRSDFRATSFLFKKALDAVGKGSLILLDNSFDMIDSSSLIIGTTLWTDMNGDNPMDHLAVSSGMNDFRVITHNGDLFSTKDALRQHKFATVYIRAVADNFPGRNVIVMTHHAPSYQSNGEDHVSSKISAGYCSSLEDVIHSHPNILYWVHGHTHIMKSYMIEQCKVMSNQMGYGYGYYADGSSKEFLGSEQPRYFEI